MEIETTGTSAERKARLDNMLNDLAWGLLFTLTGCIWLVPPDKVPEGAWLSGVAAILIGTNIIRSVNRIPVSGFSLVLGLVALLAAVSRLWGMDLPLLAICLIIIGASLIMKPLFTRTA